MCRVARAVALGTVLAAAVGCSSLDRPSAERACGSAVVEDWSDGRIDGTYPQPCYLAAIDALPEDLRAYSTAHDDIARALNAAKPK